MANTTINHVFPWGRCLAEYRGMFALSEADLAGRILGCGDGPASFNAELTERGGKVISCDPLYAFTAAEIRRRIEATSHRLVASARHNRDNFVWDFFGSPDDLSRIRRQTMARFLADYEPGRAAGRYLVAALPCLPFADKSFDLALCSHLLFLYSKQLSQEFHMAAAREIARVAREVRIYPLLDLGSRPSRHLDAVVADLQSRGLQASVEPVPYEFLRGANRMLRITG